MVFQKCDDLCQIKIACQSNWNSDVAWQTMFVMSTTKLSKLGGSNEPRPEQFLQLSENLIRFMWNNVAQKT